MAPKKASQDTLRQSGLKHFGDLFFGQRALEYLPHLSPAAIRRLLLLMILIIAVTLRFWNLDWHLPATLHPDEHNIVNRALRFGTGDLNPHFFIYGSLLMYVSFLGYGCYFLAGYLTGMFPSVESFAVHYFLDPTWFFLLPRLVSAIAGASTVWLVYLLGRRICSPFAGLVAAAAMALYADHVRESHYALPAVLGVFLVSSVFVVMLDAARRTSYSKYRLFCSGLLAGLAVSAHLLSFVAPVSLFMWICWQSRKELVCAFRELLVAALGGLLGLFLGMPFLFLDFSSAYQQLWGWSNILETTLLKDVSALSTLVRELEGLVFAFGWIGGGLVIGGIVIGMRRRLPATPVFLIVTVGYLIFLSNHGLAPPRYVLMVVPLLCLYLGIGADWLFSQLRGLSGFLASGFLPLVLVIAIISEPTLHAIKAAALFGAADTRVLSQRWINENIPAGSRLLLDGPDAHLPRLLENPERLREIQLELSARGELSETYHHLDEYYRYKALAVKKSSEPTYWIIRLKHGWWASAEGEESHGLNYEVVPPTYYLANESLHDYRSKYGIEYVITQSWQWRAFDNSRFPSAQQLYRDLRANGKLVNLEKPGPGVTGPEVYVWEISEVP